MSNAVEGIFGPDSVAWRVHADPVMLVGGLRALLVQALEPRAMAAVDQHSRFREDPWGRLARTTNFVVATTYGDTEEAEAAAALRAARPRARPRRRPGHRRGLRGQRSRPLAVDPCGRGGVVRRRVSRPTRVGLSDADADRYVAEMARVAEMVELPAAMAPRSMGELREYLRSVRGLQVTKPAWDGLQVILFPPMDLKYRPLWAIPTTAAVAILPRYAAPDVPDPVVSTGRRSPCVPACSPSAAC